MSSTAIGLQHVVPAIGTLIASIMFASPTKTMLEIRKTGKLGVSMPRGFVSMRGRVSFEVAVSRPLCCIGNHATAPC